MPIDDTSTTRTPGNTRMPGTRLVVALGLLIITLSGLLTMKVLDDPVDADFIRELITSADNYGSLDQSLDALPPTPTFDSTRSLSPGMQSRASVGNIRVVSIFSEPPSQDGSPPWSFPSNIEDIALKVSLDGTGSGDIRVEIVGQDTFETSFDLNGGSREFSFPVTLTDNFLRVRVSVTSQGSTAVNSFAIRRG